MRRASKNMVFPPENEHDNAQNSTTCSTGFLMSPSALDRSTHPSAPGRSGLSPAPGSGASSSSEEPALEDSSSLSARQKALGLQLIRAESPRQLAQRQAPPPPLLPRHHSPRPSPDRRGPIQESSDWPGAPRDPSVPSPRQDRRGLGPEGLDSAHASERQVMGV